MKQLQVLHLDNGVHTRRNKMDKITITADDDGEQEATFNKKYNKLIMAKLDEIVDWINSQG